MANFLLLYTGSRMHRSEAEQNAVLARWRDWLGMLGNHLVDGGNPFMPAVKTISADGRVTDGPVGTMATGYSIITADSMAEAVEMAKSCPVFTSGAQISVYETRNIM